jgi:hypothetical protein
VNTKQFLAIEKRLLPSFPGFAVMGATMFIQPTNNTLRGFHWEPSAFNKKEFFINAFFLPLYVPTKHLHFTFGHRVGLNQRWSIDRSDLESALSLEMQKEVPFLTSLGTPRNVANALNPLTMPNQNGYVNPHCYEALAYALVLAGELKAAASVLDRLLQRASPLADWENEIASRARLVQEKLGQPQEIIEQLAEWETETIHNIGIESFI